MKDYHDMLNSLKNKVVDAAGKAGETVTNAANKVVSDEMRDKVAGAAHAVGDRAKYASRMTRMTVDCNAELERVKRTYTEIGRLYYENYRDTADAFLAELCQQVTDANARVAELEAQMDELQRRREGVPPRAGSAHRRRRGRRAGGHRGRSDRGARAGGISVGKRAPLRRALVGGAAAR